MVSSRYISDSLAAEPTWIHDLVLSITRRAQLKLVGRTSRICLSAFLKRLQSGSFKEGWYHSFSLCPTFIVILIIHLALMTLQMLATFGLTP